MSFTKNYFEIMTKLVMREVHPAFTLSKEGVEFLYLFFSPVHDMMNDTIALLPDEKKQSLEKLTLCFFNNNEIGKYANKYADNTKFNPIFTEKIWKPTIPLFNVIYP